MVDDLLDALDSLIGPRTAFVVAHVALFGIVFVLAAEVFDLPWLQASVTSVLSDPDTLLSIAGSIAIVWLAWDQLLYRPH